MLKEHNVKLFDDILKSPNIQGYCENCKNGFFVGKEGVWVMCQVKGYTVNRKSTCKDWKSKGKKNGV